MSLQHAIDLLYEDKFIPLAQWLLKTFPVEKLVGDIGDYRLKVNLGGVELPSPVILSSQHYDPRILEKYMRMGFGAVTTKTITPEPRQGHPKVTLVRRGSGLVNCNGFKNPGMATYKEILQGMHRTKPLIVSVAGDTAEEYGALVKTLGPYSDLSELDISSPNRNSVYSISSDKGKAREIFARSRDGTDKPIIVKLSPDFEDSNYGFIIPAAIESGINIINFGNTRRIEEPRLSQGFGGYSGPDLFNNVLNNIRRIRKLFGYDIQLIATGGIDSPKKAYQLLKYAHADAVSYFTASRSPSGLFLAQRINRHLLDQP
ncbi:MAG: hypothetical protein HYW23_04425 [Candidatus Aenigmarchaeota archaeon]|nr:hypothetical protein [Candidatus Aenigmarchaeota archaeon]